LTVQKSDRLPIWHTDEIVRVRQVVREWSVEIGFSLIDQTKLVTAASELARNTVIYGKGGTVLLESLIEENRRGLRLTFEDKGPGIPDIPRALSDGYTTGNGLGLGLGGAKRLSSDFSISSAPGQGTRVMIARWRL
jgi:serine/threonine-protein kinase RsbT